MRGLATTAVLLLITAGCGGADPIPPGDGDGDGDGDGSADAGTALDSAVEPTCATPEDCPCFSNHDCPKTHACTSLDDTGENVYCVEGPRGQGAAGEPCTGEESCASALCIEDDAGSFCSDLCEDASTCPAVLPECLYIGFGVDASICAP